jgi:hypothetical protein
MSRVGTKAAGPFCLVQDTMDKWYVIPAAQRLEWEKWLGNDEPHPPEWADAVGAGPFIVHFPSYTIG